MKVRCERDGHVWTAIPESYPTAERPSTHYRAAGDLRIWCPKCGRAYFCNDEGVYESDRPLTILEA